MKKKLLSILYLLFSQIVFSQNFNNVDFEDAQTNPGPQVGGFINGWTVYGGTAAVFCNPVANAATSNYTVYNSAVTDPIMIAPNNIVTSYYDADSVNQLGGSCFIRLNNEFAGAKVVRLSKTFTITANNSLFRYAYRAVLSNPNHLCCDQPGVNIRVTVTNTATSQPTLLTCPSITISSGSSCGPAPSSFTTGNLLNGSPSNYNTTWIPGSIELSDYNGFAVTIDVYAIDCAQSGHAGYIYFDAMCSSMSMVTNSVYYPASLPSLTLSSCGIASFSVTAPAGLGPYSWNSSQINIPAGLTVPSQTNQVLVSNQSGTVQLTMNPAGACAPINKLITLTITPQAVISVSGNTTMCSGSVQNLSVTGVNSYSWSTGANTSSIAINPSSNATFSVSGHDVNNCFGSDSILINVSPSPTIAVLGNTSPCDGSSTTFTFSGAGSYSVNAVSNPNTLYILPASNTTFTLEGSNSNFCSSSVVVSVTNNTTCADVWPGDANSDGAANNLDVLELGLHFNQTGFARNSVSNLWQSYQCNNWNGIITNGKNLSHADCDGNGTIDNSDTLAIFNNYNLIHSFKNQNAYSPNPEIYIMADQPSLGAGAWGTASIYLGDNSNSISNINGLAFSVSFDKTFIQQDSVYMEYPVSFLNLNNQNLNFRKTQFSNGIMYCATTHTINNNVSGNGKIGIFHFKINPTLAFDTLFSLNVVGATKSNSSGVLTALTNGNFASTAIGVLIGLRENGITNMKVYPNPINGLMNIEGDCRKIEIFSVTGQLVLAEEIFETKSQIDMSNLSGGIYFLKIYSKNNEVLNKKIIVK